MKLLFWWSCESIACCGGFCIYVAGGLDTPEEHTRLFFCIDEIYDSCRWHVTSVSECEYVDGRSVAASRRGARTEY